MNSWVVLIRGINVGGKNIVLMKQLTELLTTLGCINVKTYIQSGNVVMQHKESNSDILSKLIAEKMQQNFGFKPSVLLLTFVEFQKAISNNPFPEAQAYPKTLHFYFLSMKSSTPDLQGLLALKTQSESFELIEQVFYLHAPDGVGRSKLAAKVDMFLGVETTARNWNTVSKLLNFNDFI